MTSHLKHQGHHTTIWEGVGRRRSSLAASTLGSCRGKGKGERLTLGATEPLRHTRPAAGDLRAGSLKSSTATEVHRGQQADTCSSCAAVFKGWLYYYSYHYYWRAMDSGAGGGGRGSIAVWVKAPGVSGVERWPAERPVPPGSSRQAQPPRKRSDLLFGELLKSLR